VTLLGTSVATGIDGWYRIDLGCPADGVVGSNTTFLDATRAGYFNASESVGRGVFSVRRLDVWLEPEG